MKKLICLIAASLIILISAFALAGCNKGTAKVEYKYSEEGAPHFIVSGVTGNKRALTEYEVPAQWDDGEGHAYPVTEIGDEAFFGCAALRKVTVPDTIKRIGNLAFAQCAFEKFIIPEGVESIGWSAFGMSSLTEIEVPSSVTSLGNRAFYCCSKLEKAVIKANITEIEPYLLYNSVATAGGNVYTDTALKELYLPATIKKIHKTAFEGNFVADMKIYFEGSRDQWIDEVYFYESVKKENGDGYVERKIKTSDVIPLTVMHFEAQ